MTNAPLDQETVIVSGGGSGIGLATVQRFRQRNARVVVIDYSIEKCRALQAMDASLLVIHADLSTEEGMGSIQSVLSLEGVEASTLVNVAGRLLVKPFLDCDRSDWTSMLAMNVGSMALMSRLVIPGMLKRGEGSIVNVASLSGHLATPLESAYCVSKAAVIQLTRSIAIEFRRGGIRCNCVSPAFVDTEHGRSEIEKLNAAGVPLTIDDVAVGQLRPAQADEIASAIVFLAGNDSSFMNGAEILLDNGWSCGAGG